MNSTHKRGAGPRLNDEQRLQILEIVEQPSPPSLRNIGRNFGVSESAIRSLIKKKDEIRMRVQLKDHNTRKTTFRGSKGKYPELEERLYAWIDAFLLMILLFSEFLEHSFHLVQCILS